MNKEEVLRRLKTTEHKEEKPEPLVSLFIIPKIWSNEQRTSPGTLENEWAQKKKKPELLVMAECKGIKVELIKKILLVIFAANLDHFERISEISDMSTQPTFGSFNRVHRIFERKS